MTNNKKLSSEEIIEKLRSKDINKKSPILKLDELENMISRAFFYSYKTDENTYNYKLVTDIIYNEKTRLVVKFKDYLIFDDISEFLRRLYQNNEANLRIKKLSKFYENYSRIFPNYLSIPESKYLYKNIRKKQKLIDKLNQIEEENKINHLNQLKKIEERNNKAKKEKKNNTNNDETSSGKNTIFNTDIKNSILKYEPESITNSDLDLVKNKLNFEDEETENFQIKNDIKKNEVNININFGEKINSIITNNLHKYNNKTDNNEIKVTDLNNYISGSYTGRNNNAIRITGGYNFFRDLEKTNNIQDNNNNYENLLTSSMNLDLGIIDKSQKNLLSNKLNISSNNNSKLDFADSDSFHEIIKQMENSIAFYQERENIKNKDENKLNNFNKNILQEFMKFQDNKNVKNYDQENFKDEKIQNNNNLQNNKNHNVKARNNFVNFNKENNGNYLIKNFEKEKANIKIFETKQNNQTNYLNDDCPIMNSNKKFESVFSNFLSNFDKLKKVKNYKKFLYHSFIQSEDEKLFKDDLIIKKILCEKYYQNYFNFDFLGAENHKDFSMNKKIVSNRILRIFAYIKKINEINSQKNLNSNYSNVKALKANNNNYNKNSENFNFYSNCFQKGNQNFNINKFFYFNITENNLNFKNPDLKNDNVNINKDPSKVTKNQKTQLNDTNRQKEFLINNNNKFEFTDSDNNMFNVPNIIIPPNTYININNNFYNLYIKQEEHSSNLNELFEKKSTPKNRDKNFIDSNTKKLETLNKQSNRINKINDLVLNDDIDKIPAKSSNGKISEIKHYNAMQENLNFNNSLKNNNAMINPTNENNNRENNFNVDINNTNTNNRENNACFSTPRKKENNENNIYDKVLRILQDDSKPKNKNFINHENLKNKASSKKEGVNRIKNLFNSNNQYKNNDLNNINNIFNNENNVKSNNLLDNSKLKYILNTQTKDETNNPNNTNYTNNMNSFNNTSNKNQNKQININHKNFKDYSSNFQTKISSQRNDIKSYDFSNIINHDIKKLSENLASANKKNMGGKIIGSSSPTFRSSNEKLHYNKLNKNGKNFESLLNSSKSKKNFNQILESYGDINLDLNFTNSINANLYLNTQKSNREFSDRINNFSNVQQRTLENERDISISGMKLQRVVTSLNMEQTIKYLTARNVTDKKKRRILSGYQSINEKLKKLPLSQNFNNAHYKNMNINQSKIANKPSRINTNAIAKNIFNFSNKKKNYSNENKSQKLINTNNNKNLSFILNNLNERYYGQNYQNLHNPQKISNDKEGNNIHKSNSNQKSFSINYLDSNKTAIRTVAKINSQILTKQINNTNNNVNNTADSNRNSINKTNTMSALNNKNISNNNNYVNSSNYKLKNLNSHQKNKLSQSNNSNTNNKNYLNNNPNDVSKLSKNFQNKNNNSPLFPRSELKSDKYTTNILSNKIQNSKLSNSNSNKKESKQISKLNIKHNENLNNNFVNGLSNLHNNLDKSLMKNQAIARENNYNNFENKQYIKPENAKPILHLQDNISQNLINNKNNPNLNNYTNINLSTIISKLQKDKKPENITNKLNNEYNTVLNISKKMSNLQTNSSKTVNSSNKNCIKTLYSTGENNFHSKKKLDTSKVKNLIAFYANNNNNHFNNNDNSNNNNSTSNPKQLVNFNSTNIENINNSIINQIANRTPKNDFISPNNLKNINLLKKKKELDYNFYLKEPNTEKIEASSKFISIIDNNSNNNNMKTSGHNTKNISNNNFMNAASNHYTSNPKSSYNSTIPNNLNNNASNAAQKVFSPLYLNGNSANNNFAAYKNPKVQQQENTHDKANNIKDINEKMVTSIKTNLINVENQSSSNNVNAINNFISLNNKNNSNIAGNLKTQHQPLHSKNFSENIKDNINYNNKLKNLNYMNLLNINNNNNKMNNSSKNNQDFISNSNSLNKNEKSKNALSPNQFENNNMKNIYNSVQSKLNIIANKKINPTLFEKYSSKTKSGAGSNPLVHGNK